MEKEALLRALIMDSIANDYEDLRMIIREVMAWAGERAVTVTSNEITSCLLRLVKCGFAKAYSMSDSPNEVLLDESPGEFDDCYFLITGTGKNAIEDY